MIRGMLNKFPNYRHPLKMIIKNHISVYSRFKKTNDPPIYINKCPYCSSVYKGYSKCFECNGIGRIYINTKEYKCDQCDKGFILCEFCSGDSEDPFTFSVNFKLAS